ncbi:MAG: OadG family protein, partial [Clostridia bacterium]|nr:OadG family protein [Clostridia bacterium]
MLTNMSLWAMVAANTDLPFPTVFVLGFGTVFVGLLALILIITLLGKILGKSAAKEAEKAAKAVPAQQP